MLIEVKARVARIIDSKTRKRTENFLVEGSVFANAEYAVLSLLSREQESGEVDSFEIQSLRISPIKEVCTEYQGDSTFITTFKDLFLTDSGEEKPIKYKILLWADDLNDAMSNARHLAQQGYSMTIEGIKEAEYEYLTDEEQGNE